MFVFGGENCFWHGVCMDFYHGTDLGSTERNPSTHPSTHPSSSHLLSIGPGRGLEFIPNSMGHKVGRDPGRGASLSQGTYRHQMDSPKRRVHPSTVLWATEGNQREHANPTHEEQGLSPKSQPCGATGIYNEPLRAKKAS